MTRSRAFTTAAARRRANPIEWVVDDQKILLRPSVDLTEVADLVEALQAPLPEGANEIKVAAERRTLLVGILRTFVEEKSRDALDAVAPDLDWGLLTEMVQELLQEYTGAANPTQEPSSSAGS